MRPRWWWFACGWHPYARRDIRPAGPVGRRSATLRCNTLPLKDTIVATKEHIAQFLQQAFPQSKCTIEEVGQRTACIRHRVGADELRPGGTVSGPVLMAAADVALYVAILGEIGIVPLTVTTSLNINFLRKPSAERDILARCTLLKVGKLLAIGEVSLYSEGNPEPVAHAVGTYAIPPAK
jgi:acyl-coenzyme A thioesterase PaaI-like protein